MDNKVDKLFKEKLEEHSLQPSARAWEKVEAHLGKKNKMALWVRVAAAIAVVGLLTFAAYNWNSGYKEPKQEIVKKEIEKQEPKQTPVTEKKEEPKQERKQKEQLKVVTPALEENAEEHPVEQIAVVPEPEVVIVPEDESQPDLRTQNSALSTQNSALSTQKGITLTYSLPPIKKQEAPAEPVVARKTGLERVIEIAKEVKNGDALGELRQAKDDIFALDFRKDKNKKQ